MDFMLFTPLKIEELINIKKIDVKENIIPAGIGMPSTKRISINGKTILIICQLKNPFQKFLSLPVRKKIYFWSAEE